MATKKQSKGNKEGEKTYQIRPVFTKKFRPQVSFETPFKNIFKQCLPLGSKRQNRGDCEKKIGINIDIQSVRCSITDKRNR